MLSVYPNLIENYAQYIIQRKTLKIITLDDDLSKDFKCF